MSHLQTGTGFKIILVSDLLFYHSIQRASKFYVFTNRPLILLLFNNLVFEPSKHAQLIIKRRVVHVLSPKNKRERKRSSRKD
jgi:hypothetical protein